MVVIDAGILAGVTKESTIALYAAGISDTTKAICLAKGKVVFADNFKSTVDLDRDLSDLRPALYWAFIKKTHFPIDPICASFVELNDGETALSKDHIVQYSETLKSNSLVIFEGTPSIRIVMKGKHELIIDAKTDYTFDTIRPDKQFADELNNAIQRYTQFTFLKSYEIKDPKFNITARFIPYINGKPDTTLIPSKQRNGLYEFVVGDKFVIEITNHNSNKVYFNILDIEPTGNINAIMPRSGVTKEKPIDLYVEGNTTRLFDEISVTIYPPIGDEIFKFFVSDKPLYMEYIATNKGTNSRNMSSDLDRVFKNSFKPSTRGEFSSKNGSVFNLNFIILPEVKK
jgi:hypothetical protein